MKQSVNLYSVDFRKQAPVLGAARIGQAGLAFLVLLVLLQGLTLWRTHQAETRLEAALARRSAESSRLVELASLYPPPEVDARVEAEARHLAAESNAKSRLLEMLENEGLGNSKGFSAQIAGLARRRVPGVWLREVHIADGGRAVSLSGSALEPALVPRFLQGLGQEETFRGQSFHRLRMQRASDDPTRIDFELGTHEETQP